MMIELLAEMARHNGGSEAATGPLEMGVAVTLAIGLVEVAKSLIGVVARREKGATIAGEHKIRDIYQKQLLDGLEKAERKKEEIAVGLVRVSNSQEKIVDLMGELQRSQERIEIKLDRCEHCQK